MSLSDASITVPTHQAYPWFFTVTCNQSGLVLNLQAKSGADLELWTRVLEASTALPAPPGLAGKEQMDVIKSLPERTSEAAQPHGPRGSLASKLAADFNAKGSGRSGTGSLSSGEAVSPDSVNLEDWSRASLVYELFNGQRDLIRGLTNLAEELRALQPEQREPALHAGLAKIPLRTSSYYPLGKSTSEMQLVLRFASGEGVVFNTKARCPLMLFIEVKQMDHPVAEVLRYLNSDSASPPGAATAAGTSELDVSSRKREAWPEKRSRLQGKSELGSSAGWSLNSMI
eukprot:4191971-Prymnesium_polylepis.2